MKNYLSPDGSRGGGDEEQSLPPERSRSLVMLHPMPGTLGAEIIGPISAEDRRVFHLNQKLRKKRINAVMGAAAAARAPPGTLSVPATTKAGKREGTAAGAGGEGTDSEEVIDEETKLTRSRLYNKRSLKLSTHLAYFLFLMCGVRPHAPPHVPRGTYASMLLLCAYCV
jgi:hypothetical protein